MGTIDELKRVESHDVIFALLAITGIICPGFATIAVLNRELLVLLDFWKLLILAISLSLPLYALNGVLWIFGLAAFMKDRNFETVDVRTTFSVITAMVTGAFYSSLLIAYIKSAPFSRFMIFLGVADALILIAGLLLARMK